MEQLNVGGQWCSSWVFLAVARDPNGAELSPLRNVSAVPALSRSKKPGRDCWAARRLFWLTKTSPPNVVKSQDKSGFRSFRLESKIFESFLPQLLFWLAAHPYWYNPVWYIWNTHANSEHWTGPQTIYFNIQSKIINNIYKIVEVKTPFYLVPGSAKFSFHRWRVVPILPSPCF